MKYTNKTLLMSAAASVLIASIGIATAQAPTGQPNAPAEKMGPALKETGQAAPETRAPGAAKTSQKASEPKADMKTDKGAQAPAPATRSTTGQAPAPGGASKPTIGQAPAESKDDLKSKGTRSETSSPGKTSTDMKADTKAKADAKADAERPAKSSEKAGETKAVTTGHGAAGTASLSTEQRTTIRSAMKQQNVQPVTNVNFSISVGTRVPRTVRFYPMPTELVTIYPSWRGYEYFLVGDKIVVVDPRTQDIVAVLDA